MRTLSRSSDWIGRAMALGLGAALFAVPLTWTSGRSHANAPVGRYALGAVGGVPTIYDTQTKLTWMQNELSAGMISRSAALTSCPAGFRVPRLPELETLLDLERNRLDDLFQGPTPGSAATWDCTWTSTQSQLSSFAYYRVRWYAFNIQIMTGGAGDLCAVRCVQ